LLNWGSEEVYEKAVCVSRPHDLLYAHAAGAANTNWRTDLRILNPGDEAAAVRVYLLKPDRDNSALGSFVDLNIPAQGQKVVSDIFFSRFSYNGSGGLLIESTEEQLVVTSRTFNQVPGGTYGQFIPGVSVDDALQAGEEGQILYLAKSDDFRSNLGFCATTNRGGELSVEIYLSNGGNAGQRSFTFEAFGQNQINDIFSAVGAEPSDVVRAVVRSTAPVVVYVSIVDGNTGDPVAVMAAPGSAASTRLAIPAAARAAGAEGSLWRTDVRIFNPSDATANFQLRYHSKGSGGVDQSKSLTLGPGNFAAYDDVMQSVFALSSANGALSIESNQPLMAYSRTYNQSSEGTFGQSIPAEAVSSALQGEKVRLYTGLSNSGFRSNAGFFNPGNENATVSLQLYDSAGSKLGSALNKVLAPGEMNQINEVLSEVGAPSATVASAWLSSDQPVLAFVSVIDNESNDPVYEAGVDRDDSGGGGGGGGGDGECVSVDFPRVGTIYVYRITSLEDETSGTTEITSEITLSEPEESIIHSEMDLESDETSLHMEMDTHSYFNMLDSPQGHYELKRTETHSVTTIGGIDITTDSATSYEPPRYQGPGTRFCQGETWVEPSVTATQTADNLPQQSFATTPGDGVVESISDTVTVEAGTFTAIRSRWTVSSGETLGDYSLDWLAPSLSLPIKWEAYDAQGHLLSSGELIEYTIP